MTGDESIVRTTLERAASVWGRRIAPALVAPLGIVLVIPILVGVVGLVIWWQGRVAVDESADAMARRQFGDRAEEAARHATELLGHADPLTDNMVAWVKRKGLEPPLKEFALRLRDLLRACPGVAYMSYGTYEGNFFGGFVDPEHGYVVTHRHYHGVNKTHKRDYAIGDDDTLRPILDDPHHGYDPRLRPWYIATLKNGRRTWSEPYVWFDIGVVGITCSDPITDENGKVIAVTTCDFHLNGLSEFVEGLTKDGVKTFVFADTAACDVIAFPGERQKFGQGMKKGKKLLLGEIDDPVVQALRAAMTSTDVPQFSFEVNGERYLAALRPIRLGQDQRWIVATYGPTAPLTAPAAARQRNALIVSAVALVVAILIAAFFARFIVRTHLRIERAEEQVRKLGSYRMTRKLDEGGMGEVWIAEHAMLARPAAIKLIRPKFLEGKSETQRRNAIERFRREARTIAGLRSRHTIEIYDFGVADDGALFYVMELLDGIDLNALVRVYGPVAPRRAARILLQAARSLHEAHERGIIHRDIKPANIFLCRQADEVDVVKVLDFGMARQTESAEPGLTVEGAVFSGTPAFMAPEQARDAQNIDPRVDTYALGCVGYWLLSGRDVFVADSAVAVLMAHVMQTPEPLDDGPVGEVVMDCLAKDRGDRPADMAVLAGRLEAVLAELPDDGWDAHAWWETVPNRFAEAVEPPDESVHLSPKRSG